MGQTTFSLAEHALNLNTNVGTNVSNDTPTLVRRGKIHPGLSHFKPINETTEPSEL